MRTPAKADPTSEPRSAPRRRPAAGVLDLQRLAGNRATTSLLRAPKTKVKKPTGTPCQVDADGTIRTADGKTVIGFKDADGAGFVKVTADPKQGRLETPDGATHQLVRLDEVTLTETDGTTRYAIKRKGGSRAVLDTAGLKDVVMRNGTPLAAEQMPVSLKDTVKLGTRVSLEGRRTTVWRLVDFPSKDRSAINRTWIQSNHDRKEYETRKGEIKKEIANLPSDLATGVEADLDVMALVSIIEGPWRSKSPARDKMASLGVFQWGATKKTTAKTSSSLGDFYVDLQARATAAGKKAEADRSDTDRFYIDAWKEATDAGLSIKGSALQLAGKDATGGEVEDALATPMGTGKLRAYQLQAAKDWLDDLRAKSVRPMTYGATLFHEGFSGNGPRITKGDRKIKIQAPATATTIGDVCSSKKALALMANLLVNRPAWVHTVVWKALAPKDAPAKAAELVDKLIAAQDAADEKKTKKPKRKPEITAANAADQQSYKALQELVFPAKAGAPSQAELTERLYTIGLEMYRIENANWPTPEQRAQRLVTTEVMD